MPKPNHIRTQRRGGRDKRCRGTVRWTRCQRSLACDVTGTGHNGHHYRQKRPNVEFSHFDFSPLDFVVARPHKKGVRSRVVQNGCKVVVKRVVPLQPINPDNLPDPGVLG